MVTISSHTNIQFSILWYIDYLTQLSNKQNIPKQYEYIPNKKDTRKFKVNKKGEERTE